LVAVDDFFEQGGRACRFASLGHVWNLRHHGAFISDRATSVRGHVRSCVWAPRMRDQGQHSRSRIRAHARLAPDLQAQKAACRCWRGHRAIFQSGLRPVSKALGTASSSVLFVAQAGLASAVPAHLVCCPNPAPQCQTECPRERPLPGSGPQDATQGRAICAKEYRDLASHGKLLYLVTQLVLHAFQFPHLLKQSARSVCVPVGRARDEMRWLR
jgi:hypothetical protein